jgi:hypothetical protein
MDINKFFVGTGASTFTKHPNGDFDARVMDVVMNKAEGKKPFMKIVLQTSFGSAPDFKFWPVTPQDAMAAEQDPSARQKLVNKIGFHKGVMVRLGLGSEQDVVSWPQERIVAGYASLRGKMVKVTVEDDPMNTQYQRVHLNGMAAGQQAASLHQQQQAAPMLQQQQQQQQYQAPAQVHAQQFAPMATSQGFANGNGYGGLPTSGYDDIPF